MDRFGIVDDETITEGACTDIYFDRTVAALTRDGRNPVVTAEVTASSLPGEWGVFCGLNDVVTLLAGRNLSVSALPEGSVFYPGEPVIRIQGPYLEFCIFETALLGFICHASGIATAAAQIKAAAGGRQILSFGSRRQHPAIARMIERAAWIGGADAVSNTCAPKGIPVAGTIPHALIMCYGNPEEAWSAFDRTAPPDVPRVYLCDTYCDEKREVLAAARAGATAVRLDTPRSRRGDMRAILEEVRWELDVHGFEEVEIFLSGGLTIDDVRAYRDIVEAFGVGGAIANAPVIDFSLDIVECGGVPVSKRGKKSGVKDVYAGPGIRVVRPAVLPAPEGAVSLLEAYIESGVLLTGCDMNVARARVLAVIASFSASEK
ncbi:nicotinate phosphoribosyltransferase [Methanomicrobiaceae archaeon CYW5]|uniref:nicotinate phosphoribosyltransferase n=1 Tax=Methanovulcanius yangii TaxID=1789227 RepID=UPI0029CAA122|nr:nicotinate phosphoribosyltransferase [Methanovulcanius yangii]MBT8507435.1 nicotinate phosphoribosyltransferase [Methanovulcanius yangii]